MGGQLDWFVKEYLKNIRKQEMETSKRLLGKLYILVSHDGEKEHYISHLPPFFWF